MAWCMAWRMTWRMAWCMAWCVTYCITQESSLAAWWWPLWQCSSARASISSGAERTPPGCAAAARATARATVAPAYRQGGHARTRSTRQLSSRLRAPAPVAAATLAAAPLPSSSERSATSYAPAASCGEATGMWGARSATASHVANSRTHFSHSGAWVTGHGAREGLGVGDGWP